MRTTCLIFAKRSFRHWFGVLFILALTVTLSGPGTATAAPTVTAHSPSAGATGVPVTATVSATFSDPMDLATITSGSVTLSQKLRIKAIGAGFNYTVALRDNGTVVGWGANDNDKSTAPAGLNAVTAIAVGSNHSVALKSDGSVVGWGYSGAGALSPPPGLGNVTAIAAGSNFTLALLADKTVAAWGNNTYGQTAVPGGLAGVTSIAAGNLHALALKANGTVVAWGVNGYGQTMVPPGLSGVTAVAAGYNHSLALKNDGSVVAWGADFSGESSVPTGLTGVIAIAAGKDSSVALKSDGTVVVWGDNSYGQGNVPAGLTGVVAIAAGSYHTVVLKSDGTLVAWGTNNYGETTLPTGLAGVTAVAAGRGHTVALKSDGTLSAWGYNSAGQTSIPGGLFGVTAIAAGEDFTLALDTAGTVSAWGRNDVGQTTLPAGLDYATKSIAAGRYHSVALKNDGTVVAWGWNNAGQTTVPDGLSGVTKVAAGSDFTLALKQDGTVTAWGSNSYNAVSIPIGLSEVTAIASGYNHAVALKSNGIVVAWGWNAFGQTTVPAGLTGVIAIAAGEDHTVALTSDGTVVAWGRNNFGQTTVPAGLSGIVGIAAGGNYTVAVKNDGTLVGWGLNNYLQASAPQDPYAQSLAAVTSYNTGSETVTLTPDVLLPTRATVIATVNTGVRSLGGIHPAADYAWSFSTNDPVPPVTTASPAGGTYDSPLNVTLTANEPATIYYTTNNSTPTIASPVYTIAIPVTVTTTIKYFAIDTTENSETPKTATYTMVADATPPVTTASPAGGTYSSPLNVTLTANGPATIYYTTNNSTPTITSPVYAGAIPITVTTTLKYFARNSVGISETPKTATYTIDTTPPVTTASPAGGTYTSVQYVALTTNEPATIYYTINGTTPTTTSTVYSGPIPVTATTTLKYFAQDTAGNNEPVKSSFYTINLDTTPPVTTASPAGGTYSSAQNVTLTANEPATIYYTTNGATPTMASPVYAGSIAIPVTTTLKYFARDTAGNSEAVKTESYTIKQNQTIAFGALPPKTYGDPSFGLAATATSGLAVTYTSSNSAVATISGTTISIVAAGSATITANQGGDGNYNAAVSVPQTLTVNTASLTVQAANATRVYGVANPTFSATYSGYVNGDTQTVLSGSPLLSTDAITTSPVDSYPITAAAGTLIAANYSFSFVPGTLAITKATATVVLGGLSTTYDGTPKTVTAITNPVGLTVTFTYNGSAAAPTAVASYTVVGSVSDPNYQGSASGTMTIAKGNQTITFGALPVKTYLDAAFALTATASSGLTVTYTSSNSAVATVSGSTVSIVGAGTATITANQGGNPNYNAAPAVAQTLTVNKALATISFGQLSFLYDGNPKPVTVTTLPAGLAVVITYDGSTTAPTDSGNYIVVATVNNANYQGTLTATEEIAKRSQTITFGPLPVKTYGDAAFTFIASTSSNLTLTFEYDPTIATIVKQSKNYLVTIVGAGTTIVTATQAGNRNYSDAPPVSQTLTVNKAAGTVTLGSLSAIYDGTAKAATATTSPTGRAVTFTYNGSATTPIAVGSYSVIGTMNDANYQGSASGTLTIAKAAQTITFGALSAKAYGNAPFNPGATASSGLTLNYSSSNPAVATISGTTLTIVGVGTTTITASQSGDGNYTPATAVPQALTVSKGTATITFGGLSTTYNGTAQAATATTTPNGLPVTLTYNGSSTVPTAAGAYTVAATVNTSYYQGSTTAMLTIAKAAQTITFGPLPDKTVGNAPFTVSATSTSGLTISYTSNNPAVATISGSTVTIVGAGTATITASQGGDGNYDAASSAPQTLTVQAAQASSGKTTVTIGAVTSYFDTVTATFAAIPPGSTVNVKLQTLTFAETVNLNVSDATVSISGGYNSAFTSVAGMTTIQGNLVISTGTLIADRLVIM